MSKKKIDFDAVRELAMALTDVEDSTIHGAPSLKVRGRLLTCPAIHRSAELRVTIDFYAHLQKQTAAKAARHMDLVFG